MFEMTENEFNECEQAERIKHDEKVKELEAENEQIKNSDTLCKLIGEQKIKITELEAQIEKMKCLLNEIYSEYGFSELVKIRNDLPLEIQEVIKEIKE